MTDLLPCPFCGGEAFLHCDNGLEWFAYCGIGYCPGNIEQSDWAGPKDKAVAAWNRRPSGWISVEERLPEEMVDVLVCEPDQLPDTDYLIGLNDMGEPMWKHFFGNTHWQPLPSPPEVP